MLRVPLVSMHTVNSMYSHILHYNIRTKADGEVLNNLGKVYGIHLKQHICI